MLYLLLPLYMYLEGCVLYSAIMYHFLSKRVFFSFQYLFTYFKTRLLLPSSSFNIVYASCTGKLAARSAIPNYSVYIIQFNLQTTCYTKICKWLKNQTNDKTRKWTAFPIREITRTLFSYSLLNMS